MVVITLRTGADKAERIIGVQWRSHAKNLRSFICPSDRRERLLRFVMCYVAIALAISAEIKVKATNSARMLVKICAKLKDEL